MVSNNCYCNVKKLCGPVGETSKLVSSSNDLFVYKLTKFRFYCAVNFAQQALALAKIIANALKL